MTSSSEPAPADGDGSAIARVQRAALERALVDADDAPAALALAGTLEAARRARPAERDDTVATTLCCLSAVFALDHHESAMASPATPAAPELPQYAASDAATDRFVQLGAALAVRRLDVSVDRMAALAGVSRTTLQRRLNE